MNKSAMKKWLYAFVLSVFNTPKLGKMRIFKSLGFFFVLYTLLNNKLIHAERKGRHEVHIMRKAELEALVAQQAQTIAQMNAKLDEVLKEAQSSKPAPKAKSTGKVKDAVFMKYNPETGKRDIEKPCTQAQKKVWENRANSYNPKTAEELQAITDAFKWSAKLDNAIKQNPAITRKEIVALGGKGCTKEMLKARKRELKVR